MSGEWHVERMKHAEKRTSFKDSTSKPELLSDVTCYTYLEVKYRHVS